MDKLYRRFFYGFYFKEAAEGDLLYSNRRKPILQLEVDTTPGRHDTLIAACDVHRHPLLGCNTYHDNFTDNLYAALKQIGLVADECPSPLNLWINIYKSRMLVRQGGARHYHNHAIT